MDNQSFHLRAPRRRVANAPWRFGGTFHYVFMFVNASLLSFSSLSLATPMNEVDFISVEVKVPTHLKPPAAHANKFIFSPRTRQWQAINADGKVVRTGHGSAGRSYCPDIKRACRTPTGTYRVLAKRGAGCRSSIYPVGKGGSPMPYCMFFSKYYAIHGSYEVPNKNASHGCIRVTPKEARWLYKNFIQIGTKVVVESY